MVFEKDDDSAEEVGSWLMWEVVGCCGGVGGYLRLWFGFLVRSRCWIDWTDESWGFGTSL